MAPKAQNPCLKCDLNVAKNAKAVRCMFCKLFIHIDCAGITEDMYKFMSDQSAVIGVMHYTCKACVSGTSVLFQEVNQIKQDLKRVEEKTDTNTEDITDIRGEVRDIKSNVNPKKISKDTSTEVLKELDDREMKSRNVVIFNFPEPDISITEGEERKNSDLVELDSLFTVMKNNLTVEECVKFTRRLGVKQDEKARPFLIGFNTLDNFNDLFSSVRNLKDSTFSRVSITPDLTKAQRESDAAVLKEVEELNKNEEDSLNWVWKAVGQQGKKRARRQKKYEKEQSSKGTKRKIAEVAKSTTQAERDKETVSPPRKH